MKYIQELITMIEGKIKSVKGEINRKFDMHQGAIPFEVLTKTEEEEEVYEVVFTQVFRKAEKELVDKYYKYQEMLTYIQSLPQE